MLKYAYLLGAKLALDSQGSVPGADSFAAMIQLLASGVDEDDTQKSDAEEGPLDMSSGDAPSWGAPISIENSQDA